MVLALFASGDLGLTCIKFLFETYSIRCVFTDNKSISIIDWCEVNNIPVFKGNPREGRALDFIKQYSIDVLFSINYIFLIDKEIIAWPKRYALNIHGSLLPKYRGRTPHVWAIINNENFSGLTIHLIDENCDTGDVVYQKKIPITTDMTGYELLQEFEHMYPISINETLMAINNKTICAVQQDNSKATFYGKRTPTDGAINWNWQKERIYNWVRAQAKPYPGAFSFYRGIKVIINAVEYDELGYSYKDPNGKIIEVENSFPIVKTTNGAIKLLDFKTEAPKFMKGEIFHA
jgi:methionyl-tRNA formyltransferase